MNRKSLLNPYFSAHPFECALNIADACAISLGKFRLDVRFFLASLNSLIVLANDVNVTHIAQRDIVSQYHVNECLVDP